MKRIILPFLLTFIIAGELEVDGNLKVSGNIDAQNQAIKNVGIPQDLTDAINGNVLQDALRDQGLYEYDYIRVKFNNGLFTGTGSTFSTSYMELGQESWTSDFVSKLNQLMLDGWVVSHRFGFDTPYSNETYIVIYELRKPIVD